MRHLRYRKVEQSGVPHRLIFFAEAEQISPREAHAAGIQVSSSKNSFGNSRFLARLLPGNGGHVWNQSS